METNEGSSREQFKIGISYALLAYIAWGCFPLYWNLLKAVPHSKILAYRIIWSAAFLILLSISRQGIDFIPNLLKTRKHFPYLIASAFCITMNWFIYIYAVNSGHVLETSLGYFISPLVSILLATLILKERLRPLQVASVILAAFGVLLLSIQQGKIPYLALALASTFGLYGLIRKKVPIDPLKASSVESLIQFVPAVIWVVFPFGNSLSEIRHAQSAFQTVLLIFSGVVTALPLLWFANAVKRLPLSTLGFFQYLSPSIQFLLAVGFFSERFTPVHAQSFLCIWVALLLYSFEMLKKNRSSIKKFKN